MPILTLDGVSKSFGALKVTDDVSLSVEAGEALGIIGPNGAGKSTLFNLITGNIAADTGRTTLLDRDVTRVSPMERCLMGVGRSFQIPQPFGNLTVLENLIVAATHGRGLPERAVTDDCVRVLEQTELLDRANQTAGSLSLLGRKRLELARTMATGPKLLLLDEIAGGLTEGECHALIATIRALHATGVTIVWIEHVLHALTSVVDRILVLDFGRVIAAGPAETVMALREVKEIGRALMSNPRVILCDELSLGLAPVVIRDIYAALPRIRDGGASVIIVEQDIGQALKVADRVHCMMEGRITLSGRPADLSRDAIHDAYFGVSHA